MAMANTQHSGSLAILTNGKPRRRVRPSIQLDHHREAIRAIVARHRGTNLRVFGSVLHGTDTEESDLDLLVDQHPGHQMTLFDLSAMFVKSRICSRFRSTYRRQEECPLKFESGSNERRSLHEGTTRARLCLSYAPGN